MFVDADDLARAALRRSLSHAGAPIAALEARGIPEMLELAPHAEVILLDALITGGDLRDTLALLHERCPGVPVVVTAGFNVYNAQLAAALARLGHEVHLLCQDRDPPPLPVLPELVEPELVVPDDVLPLELVPLEEDESVVAVGVGVGVAFASALLSALVFDDPEASGIGSVGGALSTSV